MSVPSVQQPDFEARSPWSRYNDRQEAALSPAISPIHAEMTIPGSKSLTNRALLSAALASGTSELTGILKSDDSYWCIDSLRRLGIPITVEGECAIVEGGGGAWPIRHGELYVGAAGTVARFLPGALAASHGEWILRGSKRMSERPIAPLVHVLSSLGAKIRYLEQPEGLPISILGNGLSGGTIHMPGDQSSQFLSGLLLAAPYAHEPLTVYVKGPIVQRDYVEMTLATMKQFGASFHVSGDGQTIAIQPGPYKAQALSLEPDVSTCGYFWALAALTNGCIRIKDLPADTRQPDIKLLQALERMGCTTTVESNAVEVRGTGQLKGGFTMSMNEWSDQTLTMAALAVFADSPITLTDAAHIRHHECDRIAAICLELAKLGIRTDEHPDGLTVYPGQPRPARLNPHDDHRMAMALSLIGAKTDGIRIADPGCVSKTCPDYWERLDALGIGVQLQ
ncbi:3-phosphoshikimate 1-carboxyvinyltransferase [Paenibacillus mendelii]|uniref:3-phosphoshikimate 1-carboxyvinyltransferase n=1 Tax=Paenibacillus mendelii TaxID=206163 RepID=A0ABV6J2V6_9BACL|nr:3-phosphoshikimate 1-carboxyvinyltransferase [Paenibacillus mendelii]MCQ6559319.1 3-phosphoshikimate 1-carboxyvinyltransferase [Paenibacillus mendelii]